MEQVHIEVNPDGAPETLATPDDRYEITRNDAWSNPLYLSWNCDHQRYWHVDVRDTEAVLTARGGDWVWYESGDARLGE